MGDDDDTDNRNVLRENVLSEASWSPAHFTNVAALPVPEGVASCLDLAMPDKFPDIVHFHHLTKDHSPSLHPPHFAPMRMYRKLPGAHFDIDRSPGYMQQTRGEALLDIRAARPRSADQGIHGS